MQFAFIFASKAAPLVVMAILFVFFWVAIKAVLRDHHRGDRSFLRQQNLWSNWQ